MKFEYIVHIPPESITSLAFFVRFYTPLKGEVRARAYLGNNREYALLPFFTTGTGDLIPLPYSGYVPFAVPAPIAETGEMKCTLILDLVMPNDYVECVVYGILLYGRNGAIYDTHVATKHCVNNEFLESVSNICPNNLSVHDVHPLSGVLHTKEKNLFFDLTSVSGESYLMIHAKKSNNTPYEKTKCNLFLPKNHYRPEESIVVSYSNIYAQRDVRLDGISVHWYAEGAKPGFDITKDYAPLMFKQYNRGKSGSVTFPKDGVRNYTVREPGRYSMHIHQAYQDLCTPSFFSIGDRISKLELNAPNPGTLYFIKCSNLADLIYLHTENAADLSVWEFQCKYENMDCIEQRLYQMQDVERSIYDLRKYRAPPPVLYTSILEQALQTACTREMLKLLPFADTEVDDTLWQEIISYIEENLCNNVDIQMLENHFHRSKSFFSHCFKKNIGISFATYIYQAKITRAKQWLIEQEKSISEIAELLNYSDAQTFSHAFKRIEGVSPREFQKQYKMKVLE